MIYRAAQALILKVAMDRSVLALSLTACAAAAASTLAVYAGARELRADVGRGGAVRAVGAGGGWAASPTSSVGRHDWRRA